MTSCDVEKQAAPAAGAAMAGSAQHPLFELTPIALLAVDAAGQVTAANRHAETLFGYGRGELLGQSLTALAADGSAAKVAQGEMHPWLRDGVLGALESRMSSGDRHFRGRRKDGSDFPIEIGLAKGELGAGEGWLLTLVDTSARRFVETRLVKLSLELAERTSDLEQHRMELQAEIEQRCRAEADLQRSHEDFRYLFQRNPLPMWLYDPQTLRFLQVNEAALTRYGYSREEFLAMSLRDLEVKEKRPVAKETVDERREDFASARNRKHRCRNGRIVEVDTFSRVFGSGDDAVRLVVAVDVTERNAMEAQLRQAQKMEAIGQLTGGVAHDFNNLLTIILANLELIAQECADRPAVREMTTDALASVSLGSSLTRRLLAFARQQSLEPRVLDIAGMIADMSGLLRRSLGETVHIEHHVETGLWKTSVDPGQMENAMLNLAVNARDAMPGGGTLTIEAQNAVLDEEYAQANDEVTPGEYVQIAVSDSGTGIAPEKLDHILEPFYTTKPVGHGTGLGLSMVYGFIKQSGGHMKVYSELGVGTTIKLYLPRVRGKAARGEQLALRGSLPQAADGEVVLLVEDNATIRRLVARMLEVLGYRTLTAEDAAEALAMLEREPGVDLLFTDIVLPNGTSGAALATEALARQPRLKVLYMSGYTRNALASQQAREENVPLLSKPFRKEELAQAVHRVLHG